MKNKISLTDIVKLLTANIMEIEKNIISKSGISGLTGKQIHYLEVISNLNNPRLSELAKELNLSKPSITIIVDKFEERGFIRKVKSDEDRRVSHIHMTEKGKEIEKVHREIHLRISDTLTSKLTENETKTLIDLLSKAVS